MKFNLLFINTIRELAGPLDSAPRRHRRMLRLMTSLLLRGNRTGGSAADTASASICTGRFLVDFTACLISILILAASTALASAGWLSPAVTWRSSPYNKQNKYFAKVLNGQFLLLQLIGIFHKYIVALQ